MADMVDSRRGVSSRTPGPARRLQFRRQRDEIPFGLVRKAQFSDGGPPLLRLAEVQQQHFGFLQQPRSLGVGGIVGLGDEPFRIAR
jgi:hypothetical protein